MVGGLKSSLAFAGVTLFGAAILAANVATPQAEASRDDGGYNDALYVPPPTSDATLAQEQADSSYQQESAGEFASDDQLIDNTSGFDPSADADSSSSSEDAGQSEGGDGSAQAGEAASQSESDSGAIDG